MKVCQSKSTPRQPPLGVKPKRPTSRPVRQVGEETDSDDSLQLIQTLGEGPEDCQPPIKVHVEVGNFSVPMEVDTVKGAGPTLMGRNWLSRIRLNWSKIHHTSSPGLSELLSKYDEIVPATLHAPKGGRGVNPVSGGRNPGTS